MKTGLFFSAILLITSLARSIHAEIAEDSIWNKDGRYVIPWKNMSPDKKAFVLERYRRQIVYATANLNKSFKDIDAKQVDVKGYEKVGYVTYGLIAGNYCWYGDYKKCAEYHYKDYLQAIACANKMGKTAPIPKDCWGGMVGDYDLLLDVIDAYEMGGYYKETLPYYRMLLDHRIRDIKGDSFEEKLSNLRKEAINDDSLQEGVEISDRWQKAKKLANTTKPKPLDPAVQHHEWFYSDRQEEVLKALEYYHKHNVRFMLEKALKHKDAAVAAKAKEYLERLGKDKGDGKEKKR